MKRRPSATALLVASGIAFQAKNPRYSDLVDRDAGVVSAKLIEAAGKRVRNGSSRLARAIVRVQERLTVPGLTLHYVLRKRTIENLVRAAIDEGYQQLIVLGGGFDTLAMRLAGTVRAIELDHPATLEVKRAAAGDIPGLELVPLDLATDNIADVLATASLYRGTEPAVFLVEAVFMYLWEADVRQALRQLAARTAKTRIIFTFMDTPYLWRASFIARWWQARAKEPTRWTINIDSVAAFLAHLGFKLLNVIRDDQYQRGYDAAMGEHIAVAESA